jgi:hypothetical protein
MGLGIAALVAWLTGGNVRRLASHILHFTFCILHFVFPGRATTESCLARERPRPEGEGTGKRPVLVVLGLLMLVAGGSIVHDLVWPYKSLTTLQAREFARWFWFTMPHDSEVVCLETDMKENLSPETYRWGWSALYLCNQRIYSPRHARGERPDLSRVSAEHPLRCVLFLALGKDHEAADRQAMDRWLAEMQGKYQLVARDRYPVPIYDKWGRPPHSINEYIEVFKFVPKVRG